MSKSPITIEITGFNDPNMCVLSRFGYKEGDLKFTYWVLTPNAILFYKSTSDRTQRKKPLLKILAKNVINCGLQKADDSDDYMVTINEATRSTILYGDYNTMTIWSRAISFVTQGIVKNQSDLQKLLPQIRVFKDKKTIPKTPRSVELNRQCVARSKPLPQTPRYKKLPPRPQKNDDVIISIGTEKEVHTEKRSSAFLKPVVLDVYVDKEDIKDVDGCYSLQLYSCPMQTTSQITMRVECALQYISSVLGKEVTVEQLQDGVLFGEFFEKLTGTEVNVDRYVYEMSGIISNINIILNKVVELSNIQINIQPNLIAQGVQNEIINFIFDLFECFVMRKINVNGKVGIDALVYWVNTLLDGTGIDLTDFATTFSNGKAFACIISRRRCDLINSIDISNVCNII